MDRKTWLFVVAGLALAFALAFFVAPFASQAPDGLDKFAREQQLAEGEKAWRHAPLAEYELQGVKHPGLSTALAGALGTAVVFCGALGLGYLLRRRKTNGEAA